MQPLSVHTVSVRDVMSSPVITVPRTARLPMIKRLMREKQIRHVPVVDAGRLVGIISLGDVRNAFPSDTTVLSIYELSYLLDKITAEDIVRTGLITIGAGAPLVEAAKQMLDHKVGCLPVVEAGCLVGMITESDILRVVALDVSAPSNPWPGIDAL